MESVLAIPKAIVDYLSLGNEKLADYFLSTFLESINWSILHILDPKPTCSLGNFQYTYHKF